MFLKYFLGAAFLFFYLKIRFIVVFVINIGWMVVEIMAEEEYQKEMKGELQDEVADVSLFLSFYFAVWYFTILVMPLRFIRTLY